MRMILSLLLAVICLTDTVQAGPAATQPAEKMSYLDNGVIRLGVDLDLGGAITYLSKSGEDKNLVNSFDWGRQIQMSFYSGPVPFEPDGKLAAPQWRGLGWNPIQCGDHFKNRAKILEHRNNGKEIFVRCTPMQWPLDNVPGDCTFESQLSLDGNTVHVACRLINQRGDKTQYPARSQELPAIYTNGPWWRLMTYTGDKPFTNAPLTQIPAKMPWTPWHVAENWAALVNDQNEGLGIYEPGVHQFLGGFNARPGAGGPMDNPCGYIAPLHSDILDNNIEYNYQYTLILGSLDEIRKYVYAHSDHQALPRYVFSEDRQHWHYHGCTDTGWPIRGELDISVTGPDPYFAGPLTFWQTADAPKVWIEAAFEGTEPKARLRWRPFADKGYEGQKFVVFPVTPDGKYRVYEVDLKSAGGYEGAAVQLRLDPIIAAGKTAHVRIKSISFKPPEDEK